MKDLDPKTSFHEDDVYVNWVSPGNVALPRRDGSLMNTRAALVQSTIPGVELLVYKMANHPVVHPGHDGGFNPNTPLVVEMVKGHGPGVIVVDSKRGTFAKTFPTKQVVRVVLLPTLAGHLRFHKFRGASYPPPTEKSHRSAGHAVTSNQIEDYEVWSVVDADEGQPAEVARILEALASRAKALSYPLLVEVEGEGSVGKSFVMMSLVKRRLDSVAQSNKTAFSKATKDAVSLRSEDQCECPGCTVKEGQPGVQMQYAHSSRYCLDSPSFCARTCYAHNDWFEGKQVMGDGTITTIGETK